MELSSAGGGGVGFLDMLRYTPNNAGMEGKPPAAPVQADALADDDVKWIAHAVLVAEEEGRFGVEIATRFQEVLRERGLRVAALRARSASPATALPELIREALIAELSRQRNMMANGCCASHAVRAAAIEAFLAAASPPIPMLLACPLCQRPHIDRDEWAERPHKTHRCEHCGHEWRPANVATVGVESLPSPVTEEGSDAEVLS